MNPGDNYSPTSQRRAVIYVSDIQKNAKIMGVYIHQSSNCTRLVYAEAANQMLQKPRQLLSELCKRTGSDAANTVQNTHLCHSPSNRTSLHRQLQEWCICQRCSKQELITVSDIGSLMIGYLITYKNFTYGTILRLILSEKIMLYLISFMAG